ncbi:MAG: glycosyltransferase family 4 protein [Alphaproteobacteria bacterium]
MELDSSWFTPWLIPFAWFAAVFAATLAGTGAVLGILRRRAIFDYPNQRSSHRTPTPRGGGIALVIVLLPACAAIAYLMPAEGPAIWLVLGAAFMLAVISWLDDLRGLVPLLRLAAHILAVAAVLTALPRDAMIFQGFLPSVFDRLAAGILWVWFINLFNFMDGIDGIAGVEAACIGFGLFLLAAFTGGDGQGAVFGLTIAAAALGFLWWNWHPARVFLGDVGSVPLGFLLGWLLLEKAVAGFWAAALILPLYYLADATITLLGRLVRGRRIWQAHAEHFYQKAVREGFSHAAVVRSVLAANLALIAFALLAAKGAEWASLVGAAVTVAALLGFLMRFRRRGSAGGGASPSGFDP